MARRRRRSSSASSQPILVIMVLFLVGYVVIDKGWDKRFMELAGSWDAGAERRYGGTQHAPYSAPQRNAYGQPYPTYGYQPLPPPSEYRAPMPAYQDGGYWQ